MQFDDHIDKREAQPAAGRGSAAFQPVKAAQDGLMLACRDAGAAVGDGDVAIVVGGDGGGRAVAQGVLDQIGDDLTQASARR